MDKAKVEKLIEEIESSLKLARSIASMELNDFLGDVRNRYTLRLLLVEIVESATTIGLHILRERCNAEIVEGYVQVFKKLAECGVLSRENDLAMERLARLRNLIIHKYWEVDDTRIYEEARGNGLNSIERFIDEVRKYVS